MQFSKNVYGYENWGVSLRFSAKCKKILCAFCFCFCFYFFSFLFTVRAIRRAFSRNKTRSYVCVYGSGGLRRTRRQVCPSSRREPHIKHFLPKKQKTKNEIIFWLPAFFFSLSSIDVSRSSLKWRIEMAYLYSPFIFFYDFLVVVCIFLFPLSF